MKTTLDLHSPLDFQKLFEHVPGLYLILHPTPAFPIIAVSNAYLAATKTKRELLNGALERKLLLAPIHNVTDVRADPQLASRNYWTDVGGVSHPGPFARLSATPIRLERAAS